MQNMVTLSDDVYRDVFIAALRNFWNDQQMPETLTKPTKT